jgi:hypothetical protein
MFSSHSRFVCMLLLSGCAELGSLLGEKTDSDSADTGASTPGDDDDDDSAGSGSWVVMPLLDEAEIWHEGSDLVTGIHFQDLDHGVIVTRPSGSNREGGAIFGATADEVTDIRLPVTDGLCSTGTFQYGGIVPTEDGYVAMAHACDLVSSEDGGESFQIAPVGVGDPFGIEAVLAFATSGSRTVIVRDTGVVSATEDPPGPSAVWDDLWAPGAIPPIPNPVPAGQCMSGPVSWNVPVVAQAAYVSPDTQLVAYTSAYDYLPQICISRDGGHSFYPHLLQGVPEEVTVLAPTGVQFHTPDHGITWLADRLNPQATYIYYTEDAGESWSPAELPEDILDVGIELRQAFFVPDSATGYLVGYDFDHGLPLLLKTTDHGQSFSVVRDDLAQKALDAGGGRLWTGFALDEDHIWVGGEAGLLMAWLSK